MERERKKTTTMLLRLTPEMKADIEELAEYRGLTMTGLIMMLVKEEFRKMMLEKEFRKR